MYKKIVNGKEFLLTNRDHERLLKRFDYARVSNNQIKIRCCLCSKHRRYPGPCTNCPCLSIFPQSTFILPCVKLIDEIAPKRLRRDIWLLEFKLYWPPFSDSDNIIRFLAKIQKFLLSMEKVDRYA